MVLIGTHGVRQLSRVLDATASRTGRAATSASSPPWPVDHYRPRSTDEVHERLGLGSGSLRLGRPSKVRPIAYSPPMPRSSRICTLATIAWIRNRTSGTPAAAATTSQLGIP